MNTDDIEKKLELGGRRKKGRRAIVIVITLLAIGSIWFMAERTGAEPVTYSTRAATRGDLDITVGATGNLEPTNQVDVGSELSGTVRTVSVDYNDHVTVGQVLAELDTDKLEADVKRSQASLEVAEAKVLQAQATLNQSISELARLEKVHELSGGAVPSETELETAKAAFERARADKAAALSQVRQARATLNSVTTDLSKASILSPINGIVLSRDIEPGQTVAASFQAPVLFTLAEDLTKMELHVDVDEADVGLVDMNQDATFTVDAFPGKNFPAKISQVRFGAQNSGGVVTYETVLSVDNRDLLLRPGMTATAEIVVTRIENTLLVPNAALRFRPETSAIETEKKKGVTRSLLPRRRGPKKKTISTPTVQTPGQGTVWVIEKGSPLAIPVETGPTDGINTAVTGDSIAPGTELVVGVTNKKK